MSSALFAVLACFCLSCRRWARVLRLPAKAGGLGAAGLGLFGPGLRCRGLCPWDAERGESASGKLCRARKDRAGVLGARGLLMSSLRWISALRQTTLPATSDAPGLGPLPRGFGELPGSILAWGEAFLGEAFLGEAVLGEAFLGEAFLGEAFWGEAFWGVAFWGEASGEAFWGEAFWGEAFLGHRSCNASVTSTTSLPSLPGVPALGPGVLGSSSANKMLKGRSSSSFGTCGGCSAGSSSPELMSISVGLSKRDTSGANMHGLNGGALLDVALKGTETQLETLQVLHQSLNPKPSTLNPKS